MDNPNQVQKLEPGMICELPDTVCISRSRYDELIRAEMQREVLFHAYQQMSAFSMEPVMDAIFNPDFKYKAKGSGDSAE